MRKFANTILLTSVFVAAMSSTVFAGTWKQDQTGWYWEEENGSYPISDWKWLDGNNDGIAECYYFDDRS